MLRNVYPVAQTFYYISVIQESAKATDDCQDGSQYFT